MEEIRTKTGRIMFHTTNYHVHDAMKCRIKVHTTKLRMKIPSNGPMTFYAGIPPGNFLLRQTCRPAYHRRIAFRFLEAHLCYSRSSIRGTKKYASGGPLKVIFHQKQSSIEERKKLYKNGSKQILELGTIFWLVTCYLLFRPSPMARSAFFNVFVATF